MTAIEKYAKLLESLKMKKDQGPQEMHGLKFDVPLEGIKNRCFGDRWPEDDREYLLERCRRAEENAKSETLLEDVKEVVRAAMEATRESELAFYSDWTDRSSYKEFRKLSEPEK